MSGDELDDEKVMIFVFPAEDEECNPMDSLSTYLVPVRRICNAAGEWKHLQPAFLKMLAEDRPVIRAGILHELTVVDIIDHARDRTSIEADFAKLGDRWKQRNCKVRIETRLVMLGACALWHPEMLNALLPKFIQDIANQS